MFKNSPKIVLAAVFGMLLITIFSMSGCGGSSKAAPAPTPTPTPTPTPAAAAAQIRIGDAAADSIVDFKFSIGNPIIFTMSGATGFVSITVSANRFEISHMSAKMEPVGVLEVPPATFVSAQLTIQNPELTYLSAIGTPVTITGPSQTVIIPLNPAISVGTGATMVNLDVNVANSIVSSNGSITGINFTPNSFSFTTKAVAAEAEQQDDSGEVESQVGVVSSVSGSTFTLDLTNNSQLVFNTDNTTQFKDGLTNLAGALNQIVKVEGITRADGSFFAKGVEGIESNSGSELDGLITNVSGNPATSITILTQDGIGNGITAADPAKIGVEFTADVSGLSASKYTIETGKCDFSGLTVPGPNFPFDAAKLRPGQRIEIDNVAGVPPVNGSFTADKVTLTQQAMSGTVANFTAGAGGAATFDLALPPDSYLAIFSGQTSVHVFQQPGTNNRFGTITNGSTVRVRGLLFWTGTQFNMIARRITP